MLFGIHFFPTVGPDEQAPADYYAESLALAERADALGFHSAKTVEHYFFDYGGYSPDPAAFLAAIAVRTRRLRLVTGAVLPAFNHPIKTAAQLAMLDNLSHGRLDAGFGRAFLPTEFQAFQVPMSESRARLEEGIEAIKALWTAEQASFHGRFHSFGPVRLLPRLVQQPHPPIWIAATFTRDSFEWAGRSGYHLMMVPHVSGHEQVAELVGAYRRAWRDAGHPPGAERLQLSYQCYLAEDGARARREARPYYEAFQAKLAQAVQAWTRVRSAQYPGYENLASTVRQIGFDEQLADTNLFVGDPDEVAAQIRLIRGFYGEIEPSLQFSFGNVPFARALRSMELFGQHVMPRFQPQPAALTS